VGDYDDWRHHRDAMEAHALANRPLPRSAVEGAAWMQETLQEAGVGGRVLERVRRLEREHKAMIRELRHIARGDYKPERCAFAAAYLLQQIDHPERYEHFQGEDAI